MAAGRLEEQKKGFWRFADENRPLVEASLERNLPLAAEYVETPFNDAVRYAIFPGGKRLRPILTFLGAELFGGSARHVTQAAAAVEFVHSSSLIFDDLPSMDAAAERRGKLSLHQKFGEDTALLVAISLLNSSYRLVTLDGNGHRARSLGAVLEIVDCVGPAGMVGGQSIDLMLAGPLECRRCAVTKLGTARNLKTSALIRLALRLGAIHAGADGSDLENLTHFAESLGQAYQISDDLLDIGEDADLYGPEFEPPTQASLDKAVGDAKATLLDNFAQCPALNHLTQVVDYIATRKN